MKGRQRWTAPRRESERGRDRPAAKLIGRCDRRLWGLTQEERWRRCLERAGAGDLAGDAEPLPDRGTVVLARADYVIQDSLAKALVEASDTILADRAGASQRPVAAHVSAARAGEVALLLRDASFAAGDRRTAGLSVLGPDELGSSYHHALRKRAAPYVLNLAELSPAAIERRMFVGAYKGVTDFITKWLWPLPARWVTGWAARSGVSANAVTWVSLAFVLLALWGFAVGDFQLGLVAAWIMTFLDTVDGKLARVTLTSSKLGDVLDHGIDLVHPPLWYAAWRHGAAATAAVPSTVMDAALWAVVGGYLAGRLIEGLFIWRFGIEIHAWRPIDSWFRLFTARRNSNLVLLTLGAAIGRPDLGFLAVAAWTVLSLAFHGVRLAQAGVMRARGSSPRSWLAEPSGAP